MRPSDGALLGDVRSVNACGVGIDDEPVALRAPVPPRLAGSLPIVGLPFTETCFGWFVTRDMRVVQGSLRRLDALFVGERVDPPAPGRIPIETVRQIVGVGIKVLVAGRTRILVDQSARLAAQLAELAAIQAGAVDGREVPGQGRSLLPVEETDLRHNPNGKRVSGTVREGVITALGWVGVPEAELDGALVSGIACFDVLSGGKVLSVVYADVVQVLRVG